MLSKEENEFLTRVGRGKPAGEMLRRYWWPVAFSEDIKAKGVPAKITLLAEDFALFRDGAGHLGLVALHCSHRGTSLEYGRVEENGIRCCYHGWLYDVRGNCLEQPAEAGDSTFKDRIKHPAYHAQDAGGLVFAYIGPEPAPLLPNYDLLVREDGCRVVGGGEEFCNWLQRAENSADGAHSIALHAAGYPNMAMKRPTIKWEATQFGIKETTWIEGATRPRISHFVFPSHVRHSAARIDEQPRQVIRTASRPGRCRFELKDSEKAFPASMIACKTAGGIFPIASRTASRKKVKASLQIVPRNTWRHRIRES